MFSGERCSTTRIHEVVDVIADLLEHNAEDALVDAVVLFDQRFELVLRLLGRPLLVDRRDLGVLNEIHGQQTPDRAEGLEVREVRCARRAARCSADRRGGPGRDSRRRSARAGTCACRRPSTCSSTRSSRPTPRMISDQYSMLPHAVEDQPLGGQRQRDDALRKLARELDRVDAVAIGHRVEHDRVGLPLRRARQLVRLQIPEVAQATRRSAAPPPAAPWPCCTAGCSTPPSAAASPPAPCPDPCSTQKRSAPR